MKAVFLDRDGTLNEDPGYLSNPKDLKLLPTVGEALKTFKHNGFKLVVISNQSGVARGLVDIEVLPLIHARLNVLLAPYDVTIERFYLCFHHPDDRCDCRKPSPKLIQEACRDLNLDVTQSYMIGDKVSDLECGLAAGCKGVVLVRTGHGRTSELELSGKSMGFIADFLIEAAHWICNQP